MFSEDIGAYTHSIYNNFTEIVGRSNSLPLSMEEYILLRKQAVCELEQGFTIRDSNNKVIPIGSSEEVLPYMNIYRDEQFRGRH